MMAHVAEASEGSGRVLLWLDPQARGTSDAIAGALYLARAFGSEIETLVVDDGQLGRAAALPVARVWTGLESCGPHSTAIGEAAGSLQRLSNGHRLEAERRAGEFEIPCHHTITAGDPIDQLTGLCLMNGPWNVIALPGAPDATTAQTISAIFANVSGATGIVVSGQRRKPAAGPVIVGVEDIDRLPSMLRAAERLTLPGVAIRVMLACETTAAVRDLEAQARIMLADRRDVLFESASASFGLEGTFDGKLRSLSPRFVVGRFGGTLLPPTRAFARTVEIAGAPFLLVR